MVTKEHWSRQTHTNLISKADSFMKLGSVSVEIRHRLFGLCSNRADTAVKDQVMSLQCSRDGGLDCVRIKEH